MIHNNNEIVSSPETNDAPENDIQEDCEVDIELYIWDESGTATNIRRSPDGDVDIQLEPGDYSLTIDEVDGDWLKITSIWGATEEQPILSSAYGWVHNSVVATVVKHLTFILIKEWFRSFGDNRC